MKKYKIAVIDSGICLEDDYINGINIISLDSKGFHISSEKKNMHGTYVKDNKKRS